MGLHHSIYEDSQSGALVIPLSVGVIYDSYVMSVIADSVEAEVFPCLLRYERVHCQCSVRLWLESAYSGYDEVIERLGEPGASQRAAQGMIAALRTR